MKDKFTRKFGNDVSPGIMHVHAEKGPLRYGGVPEGRVTEWYPKGSAPFSAAKDYALSNLPPIDPEELPALEPLSDDEIEAAAAEDEDNPILTPEELASFKQVSFAKHVRQLVGLTQAKFAEVYNIPLGTLRDWEQHRSEPDQAAQNYLKLIVRDPEGVKAAMAE